MKTKFFLTLIAAVAISSFSYAQTSFGIRAGGNLQNLTGEDNDGDEWNYKLKPGFHVGFNAEIPVGVDFFLQPGVLFTTKGAKFEDEDYRINLSYIEVPVNFLYKPELGNGKLLLGFGPYVAFAAGGSIKPEEDGDDVDIEFKSEITAAEAINGTPYLKRFDAGGNLLFGYEFANKLSLQLNAQLGLIKINPKVEDIDTDASLKNTGFGISLGYRF